MTRPPAPAAVRSLAVVLALSPVLAGCLLPPADPAVPLPELPAATLRCVGALCNFAATVDPPERQANELSVAVNPVNPRNIIASGKDYNPQTAGDCTYAGLYATHDGGATWINVNLPGSPWKRLNDPSEPLTDFSKYWCVTDPVVAFGPDGTAYWTVMPYQCDAASGSKTGRGVIPQNPVNGGGGLNDWMWTCSAMYVLASEDGGKTWPVVSKVAEGPRLTHDKQWIAAAPDGKTVLLCWDYSAQTGLATDGTPVGPAVGETSVVCSVSQDKARTWSAYQPIGHAGFFPWLDYGPDGRAWMTLLNGFFEGDILVTSSADGLAWEEPVKVASFQNADGVNDHGWPALRGSQFRIVPCPSVAVDPSDGSVHVAYFDHSTGDGNVYVVSSPDGKAWGAPVRVHHDGASPHDQFLPALSVGPDGVVDVSWYDRRDDPQNYLFHLYHAYSEDGGATWSENLRVTDVASDEKHSHHQNGMIFLGDYRDSDSVHGANVVVWVDTRHEKADAFVSTLLRS